MCGSDIESEEESFSEGEQIDSPAKPVESKGFWDEAIENTGRQDLHTDDKEEAADMAEGEKEEEGILIADTDDVERVYSIDKDQEMDIS